MVEEVFAEDYDDPATGENPGLTEKEKQEQKEEQPSELIHEVINIYRNQNGNFSLYFSYSFILVSLLLKFELS